ncbi:MAG: hypothetical protein HXX17_02215 [Geobacteraceae bacterium]|nr:hypothetical protein [Geobacteraceae bacterium]
MKYLLLITTVVLVCFADADILSASTKTIKYIYIEANEGDSAAGHTAIRFGKDTFHFQHEPSGLIRIKRFDSLNFDYLYSQLGNRGLKESWISVSDDTYALIFDGFSQFLLIQDEQFNLLETLRKDVTFYEFLLQRNQLPTSSEKISSYPLRGLAYLFTSDLDQQALSVINPAADNPDKLFSNLKNRINDKFGENYLSERITSAQDLLRKNRPLSLRSAEYKPSKDSYPAYGISTSTLFEDSLLALYALEYINAPLSSFPDSYWSMPGDSFRLSFDETVVLRLYAEKIENDLLDLISSSRSDWGYAFILGLARLASIHASISSGTFVFPDIFSSAPSHKISKKPPEYLKSYRGDVEKLFQKRRKEFFESLEMRESDYAALEYLGNNFMELDRAINEGVIPRDLPEIPVPSRLLRRSSLPLPEFDQKEVEAELEIARLTEKEYGLLLSELYNYDLFKRNCVTEIFNIIDGVLQKDAMLKENAASTLKTGLAKDNSVKRLGGYVDPAGKLSFIPFVSSGEVDACYSVTEKRVKRSYRSERLAEMKQRESSLTVFLRESNTITSTIYSRSPNDSPFIFFTDDTVLFRPLFGIFNLMAGVGETLVGVITLPFEGSKRVYLGAKGILFSLPELFFINIRKGSLEYLPEGG